MISFLTDLESKPVSCLTTTNVQNPWCPNPLPAYAFFFSCNSANTRSETEIIGSQTLRADWFTLEPNHLLDTGQFSASTNLAEAS